MNTDNGFALINTSVGKELVTARVNGHEVSIGLNAKCGDEVLAACVHQANQAPSLAQALANLLRLEGTRDDGDSELVAARAAANDALDRFNLTGEYA